MRKHWRAIAQIVKTHGKKGEVVTVPVHGLPSLIAQGMTVVPIPPPLRGPRSFTVTSVENDNREGSLVSFSGVSTISDAEEFFGKTLLVEQDCLPENVTLVDATHLIGREVQDFEYGFLGEIVEVLMGSHQNLWALDGPYGHVLIPVVDEFIMELPSQGQILVTIPQGLLELGD